MTDLLRTVELTTEGRTLIGVAFKWDHPSSVVDPGTAAYLEEFTRGSVTKTLAERGSFPLLKMHRLDTDPLGVARFTPAQEGLLFEAPMSRTVAADETLELVRDGAMGSVSVRFRPIHQRLRHSDAGSVVSRTEIALRELSLAPTGFGQHEGAGVLAVRSEGRDDQDDQTLLLEQRLARRRQLVYINSLI